MHVDKSGPQSSKYCDDDGVYYTYNFIEEGAGGGNVGLPWGADQLARADINFTVRNKSSTELILALRLMSLELVGHRGVGQILQIDEKVGSKPFQLFSNRGYLQFFVRSIRTEQDHRRIS